MKKVLIATTNKDKYSIVSELLKRTIFNEKEYEIIKLSEDMNLPDEKETGDNVDELREGDYIFVRNMNTFFIITEKKTEVDSRSAEFSTYNRMNKLTTFRLRGLL